MADCQTSHAREVADCVRNVEMRKYPRASFGGDWRTNVMLLAVVPVHVDSVVALYGKVANKTAEIDKLKRPMRETRGGVNVGILGGNALGVPLGMR